MPSYIALRTATSVHERDGGRSPFNTARASRGAERETRISAFEMRKRQSHSGLIWPYFSEARLASASAVFRSPRLISRTMRSSAACASRGDRQAHNKAQALSRVRRRGIGQRIREPVVASFRWCWRPPRFRLRHRESQDRNAAWRESSCPRGRAPRRRKSCPSAEY
jgi:hypothetical protein